MVLRTLGGLLILISGSLIGWLISLQYSKRIVQLQQLQLALNIFETEISYTQKILADTLQTIGEKLDEPLAILFKNTARKLTTNQSQLFFEIWQQELQNNQQLNCLSPTDNKILKEWGQQLGISGITGQQNINKLTVKRLEYAEKQAKKIAASRIKLSRYGGVLLSLLLILLLY